MPSTFSQSLRIEEIASGEASGTWGVLTNNNLGNLIEQSIAYTTSVDVTSGNVTLTSLNGLVDQARSAVLEVTGTPGVTRVITVPNVQKTYTVRNRTANIAQVKTASGTAFDCPALSDSCLVCNGSNGVSGRSITDGANAITSLASPFTSPAFTGTPTAPTAAQGTNTTQLATTAFVNAEIASDTANLAPLNSPALTGIPTAPTAAVTTNTTQLATTAFVNAEIANDAPTKTGGGASGTWGINVTGNAATATSATSATSATNATNVTGTVASGVTGTTQAFGTNTTQIATTAFVQAVAATQISLQAVYPVGSVYINASDITSPATLFGFGTWLAIGAGRVLVGQDTGDALFDVMGETGGSKDAIVVTHTHTTNTVSTANLEHSHSNTVGNQSADHNHGVGTLVNSAVGAHNHNTQSYPSGSSYASYYATTNINNFNTAGALQSDGFYPTTSAGAHNHTISGSTGSNSASHNHTVTIGNMSANTTHSHTVTLNNAGSSGTNANVQPYLVVKMWQRTA